MWVLEKDKKIHTCAYTYGSSLLICLIIISLVLCTACVRVCQCSSTYSSSPCVPICVLDTFVYIFVRVFSFRLFYMLPLLFCCFPSPSPSSSSPFSSSFFLFCFCSASSTLSSTQTCKLLVPHLHPLFLPSHLSLHLVLFFILSYFLSLGPFLS